MTVGSTRTRDDARGSTLDVAPRHAPVARLARTFGPAVAILAAQQVFFPAPAGIVVRGLVVGGLTALVALGMALVYRANRIINFAQADLGLAPTVLAFLLIDRSGWPYPVALGVGLAAAVLLAGTTERVVIRRFSHSPRLLVTVATIGLSQVLVAVALLLPQLWDVDLAAGRIAPPFDATATLGAITFDANDLLALIVTPVVLVAVTAFLRRSDAGTAIRAAADSADRAALLGVPVARLQTLVWVVAGVLAYAAVFLRSGILDLPTGTALGFGVLLRALVALLLGRLTDLPGVTSAAVALGVLELGIAWDHDPSLIDPVLGLVVIVALVWRRRQAGRVDHADTAAWRAADEVRPVPRALADLAPARLLRWGWFAAIGVVALVLGQVLAADQQFKASAVLIYGILGLSLVLLSGWGGVVSLGQVAFFAIGAAVTGFVVSEWEADLFAGLVLGMVAAAAVAVLVGIPALRLRGLYLAVVTFAFALATTSLLVNDEWSGWVPSDRIGRVPLLGGLEAETEGDVYHLALVVLVVVMLGLRGIRTTRFGRALVAVRDNEAAAGSYAVDPVRLRLAAFSLSAAVAALAGGLFVHHERAFDPASYAPIENLAVLTMVVVGGMTSLAGAVLGALALLGSRWFLDAEWQFLATGVGVLLVLLAAPQGLAGLAYRVRDRWLRSIAARHGLRVAGFGASPGDVDLLDAGTDAPGANGAGRAAEAPAPGPSDAAARPDELGAPLLQVRDLDAGYGGVPVLHGVDLAIAPGESVALLGTNGQGSSVTGRGC
jgi:branched-chain amino acid transport system permease protein